MQKLQGAESKSLKNVQSKIEPSSQCSGIIVEQWPERELKAICPDKEISFRYNREATHINTQLLRKHAQYL